MALKREVRGENGATSNGEQRKGQRILCKDIEGTVGVRGHRGVEGMVGVRGQGS